MMRAELYKIWKRKLVWEILLGMFLIMAVSELYLNSYYFYGGHYEELQEEIKLHEKYRGVLTDERLQAFLEERWGDFYRKYPDEEYNYMDAFFDADGNELTIQEISMNRVFPNQSFPIQFGFYQGWALFLDQLARYLKLIPVFAAVVFSSLFSYERECGMEEILACTRNGREDCIKAKIRAAFLVTNAVYFLLLCIPCGVAFFLYRGKGLGTSIQLTPWIRNSQLAMDYGTLLLHTFFLSIVIVNVTLLVALTAAFRVKSPMKAACITLAVLFLLRPDLISGYLGNAFLNQITSLTPINAMDTLNLAKQVPINIGNLKIHWLTIAEIMYSAAFVFGGVYFLREFHK